MKVHIKLLILIIAFFSFLACKTPMPVIPDLQTTEIYETELSVNEFPAPQVLQAGTASMRILGVNSNRADILVTVNFNNPNRTEITSLKITYNYYINRTSFIRGIIDDSKPLAALSVSPVTFRLIVNYNDLFRSFPALRNSNEAPVLLVLSCEAANGETANMEVSGILPIRR